MVSEAVANGDVAALNYFVAEKYLKAFGQLAESPNQKVLILPMEATSVLGSLAGIGEIAKATFGGDDARRRRQGTDAARGGRPVRRRLARPDRRLRMNSQLVVTGFVSLGDWNWFILAAVFFAARS